MSGEISRDGRGRYVPGQSGNPAGRKPNTGLRDEVYSLLEEPTAEGATRLGAIAQKVLALALEGDMRAIEFLGKRIWPERHAFDIGGSMILEVVDLSDTRAPVQPRPDVDGPPGPQEWCEAREEPASWLPEVVNQIESESIAEVQPAEEPPKTFIRRDWENDDEQDYADGL